MIFKYFHNFPNSYFSTFFRKFLYIISNFFMFYILFQSAFGNKAFCSFIITFSSMKIVSYNYKGHFFSFRNIFFLNPTSFCFSSSGKFLYISWQSLHKKCSYPELFWSTFFLNFLAFELNAERYFASLHIQSEYQKMQKKYGRE